MITYECTNPKCACHNHAQKQEIHPAGLIDRTGTACTKCAYGSYRETRLTDDWDGVLHCTDCGDLIDRHVEPAE